MSRRSSQSEKKSVPRVQMLNPRFRKGTTIDIDGLKSEISRQKEEAEATFKEQYGELRRASLLSREEALLREMGHCNLSEKLPSTPGSEFSSCSSSTLTYSGMPTEEEWRERMDAVEKTLLEMREHILREMDLNLMDGWKVELPDESAYSTGVTSDFRDLEFPDLDMKASLEADMLALDDKYAYKVTQLKGQITDRAPTDGWTVDDHQIFWYIHNKFPRLQYSHHKLGSDILKRLLPEKSCSELDKHERWWHKVQIMTERMEGLLHSWRRDKEDMLDEAIDCSRQIWELQQRKEKETAKREKQQALCKELRAKVTSLRIKKLQAMQDEQDMMERERKEEEKIKTREQAEERERRKLMKEDVKKYKEEKMKEACQRQARLEEHAMILRFHIQERKEANKERVGYRRRMEREKEKQKRAEEEAERVRLEERKKRLDALRKQVHVEAKRDPERLIQDTQATLKHKEPPEDNPELHMQTPLFKVTSFTTKDFNQDPSLKPVRFDMLSSFHPE